MPDLSDKDIDKLFQEGVERHGFEYKEASWSQMLRLMERERRRRAIGWISGIGALAILVLFFWFILGGTRQADPKARPDTEELSSSLEKTPSGEQLFEMPGSPETKGEMSPEILSSAKGPEKTDSGISPPATSQDSQAERPAEFHGQSPTLQERPPDIRHPEYPPQEPVGVLHPIQIFPTTPVLPPIRTDLAYLTGRTLPPEIRISLTPDPGGPITPRRGQAFYLGINVALEAVSASLNGFDEPALKAGLTLEYRFSEKWGLGLGAFYSRKEYYAKGDQYNPEGMYWPQGVPPDRADGYCKMIEVPLFASYHFGHFAGDHFYIEAGLNSYIMLEEHYWYDYDYPPSNPVWYYGSEGENHAWMSVLQISPGYQWSFSRKLGLQVSPYLHLPLNGVGYGNIDLISAGLNLRLLIR